MGNLIRGHAKGGQRHPFVFKEVSGLPAPKANPLADIAHECVTFCQCHRFKRLRRWVTQPTVEPSQVNNKRQWRQLGMILRIRFDPKTNEKKTIDFLGVCVVCGKSVVSQKKYTYIYAYIHV